MKRALCYWTEKLGVGPFYVLPEITFKAYRYRGAPAEAPVCAIALAQTGDLQIELIQQLNTAPSGYREFLSSGRTGVHHYSSWFGDRSAFDDVRAWAVGKGFAIVHESASEDGNPRFCYFDAGAPDAAVFEISEALAPGAEGIVRIVADAAQGWGGEHPVRDLRTGEPMAL